MANKPTIYGFDDAGCKWEISHKEDVHNIKVITPTPTYVIENRILTMTVFSSEIANLKSGDLAIMNIDAYKMFNNDSSVITLERFVLTCGNTLEGIIFGYIDLKTSDGNYRVTDFNLHSHIEFGTRCEGSYKGLEGHFVIIGVRK